MNKRVESNKKIIGKFFVLIICLSLAYIIAVIANIFISTGNQNFWYLSNRPIITPSNTIFAIITAVAYFLIALALYFSCTKTENKKQRLKICLLFGINFILNALWAFTFFGLENAITSFVNMLLILISTILIVIETKKFCKTSYYLLIPYLLWVIFLTIINLLFI